MVKVIKLNDIDEIKSIQENGKEINIGSYRSLQSHPDLEDFFLKEGAKLSIAFTALEKNSEVPCHKHPMESVIVVINGQGEYFGEFTQKLTAGDIVKVPSNSLHGFRTSSNDRLECLSIQNDGVPIYKKEQKHRANFISYGFNALQEQNTEKGNIFSDICNQINTLHLINGEVFKTHVFSYIKRWSECFQVLLFLRQANTRDKELLELFTTHLEEEIGHQKYLSEYEYKFDPLFEGLCSWFERSISITSDIEKAILMHMVLETAGEIFSASMKTDNNDKNMTESYIELHSDLDEGHAAMGRKQIEEYCNYNADSALKFNEQCWDVFNKMFSYIIDSSVKKIPSQLMEKQCQEVL